MKSRERHTTEREKTITGSKSRKRSLIVRNDRQKSLKLARRKSNEFKKTKSLNQWGDL